MKNKILKKEKSGWEFNPNSVMIHEYTQILFAGMARSYTKQIHPQERHVTWAKNWVAAATSHTPAHDSTAAAAPFRA